MSNPFDDESRPFKVLVNAEQQHSLWPSGIDIPQGWTTVLDDAPRDTCLAFVEEHWTDLRPASLRGSS
ncbi:MbtH family protein [Streptomyces sp. GXMU-J15]|uniref:MbtH family protein n=1 Tax=Streptomyces fuscus TaxID=3048495 RepID=A0ABT7JBJ0_9ACTN|nr:MULTISPECIES: MbtH family protein [Streptomyces]MDL2082219.1 MbtH family protein [Streptomyces fuscus]SBT91338.1 MbtH protein [Streptomyces sp. DI166]